MPKSQPRLHKTFPLAIIILLAAFFRLHQLDSLPPGLYHDEAVNGIDALRLLRNDHYPLFFPSNGGREPLHIYLQAFALYLFGGAAWSLRFMSALMGIFTIPLVYRLVETLYHEDGKSAHRMGILAAASLTFSYWHISFSRIAFRGVYLLPLLITAILLFWRGWHRQQYRSFAGSGVALGLSLYTYLPARLLSLLFIALVIFQLSVLQQQAKSGFLPLWQSPFVRGSLLTAVIALLIFSPLGIYFQHNPDTFFSRSTDVSIIEQDGWQKLGRNIVMVSRMFIDKGDNLLRHNLPGRPVLNIIESFAFIAGLTLSIKNFRQPRYLLLLLWFVIFLLPTILTVDAPHSLRAIGALPAAVIFISVGLVFFWEQWMPLWPKNKEVFFRIIFVLFCLISGTLTYKDYFQRWAQYPDLASKFNVQEYALAQKALNLLQNNDVALPLALQNHPTFSFLAEPVISNMKPIESWKAQRPVILLTRQENIPTILSLWHQTSEGDHVLSSLPPLNNEQQAFLSNMTINEIIYQNERIGQFSEQIGSALPKTAEPANVFLRNFDNKIELIGYAVTPHFARPGQAVMLTLYWQSQAPTPINYNSFAHLYAVNHDVVAQQNQLLLGYVYPTSLWTNNDAIVETYRFVMPDDAKPGKYHFDIGLFDTANGERLPILNENQAIIENHVFVGAITVVDSETQNLPSQTNKIGTFGQPGLIALQEYNLNFADLSAGDILDVDLFWQALDEMPFNYTVFVHILDKTGNIVAQHDDMPGNGRFPTSLWFIDEMIRDRHQIPLPTNLPSGTYQIAIGLYNWATGERLRVFTDNGQEISNARLPLPTNILITDSGLR